MRPYAALVLFSYPLHPPGRPERTEARIAHWPAIRCPVLLLSGESDPFARIELLRAAVPTLPERRTGHVSAARAHPQAGARRRPRSGRALRGALVGGLDRASILCPPQAPAHPNAHRHRTNNGGRTAQPAPVMGLRSSRHQADVRRASPRRSGRKEQGLRVRTGRRSAVVVAVMSAVLILGLAGVSVSAAKSPPGLKAFMAAVGQVESGGRYTARNPNSGAYGKYQIMPSNWPSWAGRYLGNSSARQTPGQPGEGRGREVHVAVQVARQLATRRLLVADRIQAHVRLVSYATRYVNRVMKLHKKYGGGTAAASTGVSLEALQRRLEPDRLQRLVADRRALAATPATRSATRPRPAPRDDQVHRAPASPCMARSVRRAARPRSTSTATTSRPSTCAAARSTPGPRCSRCWHGPGSHTLVIEVVGTKGRPMVAIDEFRVRP